MIKRMVRDAARSFGYDLRRFGPGADSLTELRELLRPIDRPVVFDVGAHHGQTARTFAASFQHADLYCFEPFPESFAQLKQNSGAYPSATLEPMGFSDTPGRHEFNSNESSPTNSLLELDSRAAATWCNSALTPVKKIACDFDTVDSYIARKGIQRIDLLKMDVQGAEFKVLKGAEESLRANKIRNVYMEVLLGETYAGQLRFGDYLNLLDSYGFRLQGLFNFEHGAARQLIQLDALFARR